MKRIISFVLALTMLFSTLAFSTSAYAVEYVTVYLNDKLVDFPTTDARPQIINNRTYVPVRRTCEALGLTLDWNSKTETMTLTRDGVVIAHTMRSKTVLINGEAKSFDTASINKNNRILMPIRMIAESIGATVTWDDPTRSVHITTTSSSDNSSNNNANNNTTNTSAATVSSLTASKTAVAKDTEVTISAVCSKDTTSVKFVKSNDKSDIGSTSKYTENSDGTRTFTTEYKCENNTNAAAVVTIDAVAGIGSNYNESLDAVKSVSIIVSADDSSSKDTDKDSDSDSDTSYKSDNMISCKLTSSKIRTDDYARFKVKTNSKVKKVRLTTNANSSSSVISTYDEDDDGNRTFNGKVQMTKEGDWKVYVTLYVSGDYENVNQPYDVTVSDKYSENTGSDDLEILDSYNREIVGFYNYYSIANNCAHALNNFSYIMEYSMYKTFAGKYKCRTRKINKKYRKNGKFIVKHMTKAGVKERYFYDGGFKRKKPTYKSECDTMPRTIYTAGRTSLVERLKAHECELCGATDDLVMHHVRKLKNLQGKESWERHMIARKRKTIAVCRSCHKKIHDGKID